MPKNKRKSDLENADAPKEKDAKGGGKGMRTGVATLTICAAAFGAYYSPHFRTASSEWLERWRAFVAKTSSTDDFSKENDATADERMREKLAQAPSFRDFLADEYGEEGARELLGIDESATDVPESVNAFGGFADYVVAETAVSEPAAGQGDASGLEASPLPEPQEPTASFADYVAAETEASELAAEQGVASGLEAPPFPEPQEPSLSFAERAEEEKVGDFEKDDSLEPSEKTRLASDFASTAAADSGEDEATLASRLQAEMAERGVGAPRVERWGGRFWRASGFATTDGVATFCEAIDVDPTAAQRAALAKFDAAKF